MDQAGTSHDGEFGEDAALSGVLDGQCDQIALTVELERRLVVEVDVVDGAIDVCVAELEQQRVGVFEVDGFHGLYPLVQRCCERGTRE